MKLKPKEAKLEKNLSLVDNRKKGKVDPYRNEKFLKFVRTKKCCVSWCCSLSVPHHLVRKKLGVYDIPVIEDGKYIKGGVVNLCPIHHNLKGIKDSAHQMGDKPFQAKFNVDFGRIAMILWHEYDESGGKDD